MPKIADFVKDDKLTEKPMESVVVGRIIKLAPDGWGFISSKDIPFTRIFFHWTSLRQDTLKFLQLKAGMNVEFIPAHSDDKGTRAIKIKVIDNPIKTEETQPNIGDID